MREVILYAFLIIVIFLVGCSQLNIKDNSNNLENNKIIVPKPGEPLIINPPPVPPAANMGLKSPLELERESLARQNNSGQV